MHSIGFTELLLIFGIMVLLFGTRLPSIGKSLGEGIKNFKKGLNSTEDSDVAAKTQVPPEEYQRGNGDQKVVAAPGAEASRLAASGTSPSRQVVDVDVHHDQK